MSRLRIGNAKDDEQVTPDEEAWRDIGLEVDQTCTLSATCSKDGGLVNDRACKGSAAGGTDGNKCLDNAIGEIFSISASSPEVGGKFGVSEQAWNCSLHRGEFSTIYKISRYNGRPYDPSVRLDVYTSIGRQSLPGWSCLEEDGKLRTDWHNFAPWPPTVHWQIIRRSIALSDPGTGTELPEAHFADPAAFVRGGYLFAQLPNGTELWLNGQRAHVGGFRNVIHRAVFVGKLVRATNGTWSLEDGTISGVVFPSDLLKAFEELGLCRNMCGSYDLLRDYLNLARDALTSTDRTLPESDCNGISMGLSIRARQASADRSDIVEAPDPVNCPDPRDPTLPRQGCVCQPPPGGCILTDGGTDAGTDGGT